MYKGKFNPSENPSTPAPQEPQPKKTSFADLDLGLDFDLSFLDDIDESVLTEEPAPVKKPTPAKSAPEAPARKPASASRPSAAKAPQTSAKPAPGKTGAAKPASSGKAPAGKAPAGKSPASTGKPNAAPARKQPAPQPEPAKKQKKGPRVGGVIFYTLYFMFILVFFIATYIGLQWLHGWLSDYEAAQPTVKAEQVFKQHFTSPDWASLYAASGAQDSAYEGVEEYVAYMTEKVGTSSLTYMETSAGLSGNMKYDVYLGNEKVASFTLVDKNKTGAVTLENLENITDIPDWQLGAVEVFFDRPNAYLIEVMYGHTAYVNDVALDDSFDIQIATTVADDGGYLPEGTVGSSICTKQVTGLMNLPTVTVFDDKGNQMEVTYDETTKTFTERTESNTITEDQKTVAIEAGKTFCLWMIKEVTDRGTVAKYFDPSSDAYNSIVRTTELWMQSHNGYAFADEAVTNFTQYGDSIFAARVSMTLNVTRTDGTVKPHAYEQSLVFQKNDAGKWLVIKQTNVDIFQPVGKVRLTFMDGTTQLTTGMYSTDSSEVITPILPEKEGKVFTGWVTVSQNESGDTVYNLEFQPDPTTGKVAIPEGKTLKPMTLYALYQNENEVQQVVETPAETASAETATQNTTEGA